jgi:hypothetical protein
VAGALAGVIVAVALPAELHGFTIDRVATGVLYGSVLGAGLMAHRPLLAALRAPAGFFLACAVGFGLLTAGPYFVLADGSVIPSPALLLARLPGFSGIRASARWGLLCAFNAGLAAGCALNAIRPPPARHAAALLVILVIALDVRYPDAYLAPAGPPLTWQPRAVDRFLLEAPGPGAVLELPVRPDEVEAARMRSRLHHRRPLVNGYAGGWPAFSAAHWTGPNVELWRTGNLGPADVEKLRAFGARFWVVHRGELSADAAANLSEAFGPVARVATLDDGRVVVYEDPAPAARVR